MTQPDTLAKLAAVAKWLEGGCDPTHAAAELRLIHTALTAQALPAAPEPDDEPVATVGTTAIVDAWNALPNELRLSPHLIRLFEAVKTCRDVDAAAKEAAPTFEDWWQRHGQLLRAGGGDYEKTFAYHSWLASPQAAQQAAQAPAGWQPIESAPAVDALDPCRWVQIHCEPGEFQDLKFCPPRQFVACLVNGLGGFQFWSLGQGMPPLDTCKYKPTHWMPLPQPPQPQEDAA